MRRFKLDSVSDNLGSSFQVSGVMVDGIVGQHTVNGAWLSGRGQLPGTPTPLQCKKKKNNRLAALSQT